MKTLFVTLVSALMLAACAPMHGGGRCCGQKKMEQCCCQKMEQCCCKGKGANGKEQCHPKG